MAQSKFLSLTGLDTYDAKIKDWVEKKGYTTPGGHNHDGRYYTETEVNNLLNNYLKLAGGTMTSTAQIQRPGTSTSWYLGRSNAMIKINSYSGYNALASMKTTDGDWSMGVYSDNKLYFTYVTDTNFNNKNNTTTAQIIFNPDGTIIGSPFKGAGVSAAGTVGLVPQPAAGKQGSYLRGDGTWATPTNTTYGAATQSTAGLMSAADKKKLDGIASGANAYSLPLAASGTRGGIQIGYTESGANIPLKLSSEKGYVTLTKNSVTTALGYTPPTTNTTYNAATQSAAGLMSAADKKKLDGIAAGANNYTYTHPTSTAAGTKGATANVTGTEGQTIKVPKITVDSLGHVTGLTEYTYTSKNTTYSGMKGAGASAAGSAGLVPGPGAGYHTTFLRGDGTWAHPSPSVIGAAKAKNVKFTDSSGGTNGMDNARVLAQTDSYSIAKGTWDYAGNGYLTTSGFGNIDLAGASILTFGNSSAYTQLFITAPTTSGVSSATANDILFYQDHGSGYSPGWTRILTNRNSGVSLSGNTLTVKINGTEHSLTNTNTVYTHPTTAGNKHIPSGGSSGQFLAWSSAGTAKWVNNPNTDTKYTAGTNISISSSNVISATDTVYTHPTTAGNKHIPSGGSSGQFLGWSADGTAKWVANPNTDTNTWRTVQCNGTSIGDNTLNLKAGTNVSISNSNGTLTISSTDTNTVYTHPTTAGNKHIPSGGSSGQFLAWDSAGTAKWVANPNTDTKYTAGTNISISSSNVISATDTTYSNATTSKAGLMSAADKTKLDGIDLSGGITKPDGNTGSLQDALDALKTLINNHSADTDKHKDTNTWRTVQCNGTSIGSNTLNLKAGTNVSISNSNGTITISSTDTDTVYTHPSVNHIPSGGSSGQFLGWSSSGTAKWVNNPNTDTNTWRTVQCNGTSIGDNTLNLKAGTNVSISNSNGTLTISSTDTNTVYTHPTTSGSKHIPSGGKSGQFLGWSADGTAKWVNNPNTNTDTQVTNNTTTSKYYLCGSTSSSNTTGTLVKRSTVYVDTNSAVYASGGFYETSDERLKNFGEPIEVDLEKIKKLPKKYFTWKKDKDNKLNIGTSAQELQKLYPEIVSEGNDGYLNVNYEKLSIVALAAIDKLQDKYDKKIQELEDKLNKVLELIK